MPTCASVPLHRRIVTAHVPLPVETDSRATAGDSGRSLEPAVSILFDDDQAAYTGGQIWHGHTPANESTHEDRAPIPVDASIYRHGGSACRTATLMPGQVTPWHRTSSLDYNIVTHGQVKLLTPRVPTAPEDWPPSALMSSHPDILETVVNVGEVVVQRGTVHAWRNESKTEVARWTCVLTDAEPLHGLPDVWVEEGGAGVGKILEHKPLD